MEKSECGLERNPKFQKERKRKKLWRNLRCSSAVNQQELMIFTQGYGRK